jgi:hypothetical protein
MQSSSNLRAIKDASSEGFTGAARLNIKPVVLCEGKMTNSYSNPALNEVCVVIPTYKRSDGLRTAIESLFQQAIMAEGVRVLVVDNNPLPAEKALVTALALKLNHEIEYVHEPNAGVSNARNAAMKVATTSRYIAFLDDDMKVGAHWLYELLQTSKALKAGLVFGPTHAVMPHKGDPSNVYMEPFFERKLPIAEDGYIEDTLGTGGCLIDLKHCQLPSPPFNPDLNERGGEDDIFFDHLKQTGTRVAWSAKAESFEIVPTTRATHNYIWKRNFGYGQGPARIHASRGLKGAPKVIYFMAAGALQLLCYTPILLALSVMKRPAKSKYLALTARALGKIFWQDKFSPLLYGQSAHV